MVWIPLSDGDPLPGDPDGLARLAALLQREADDMRDALIQLRAVNSAEFWEGDAAAAFAEARGRVAPDLELVIGRIQLAADALRGFIPAMGDCQQRGRIAVNRAREADETLARAQVALGDAMRQAFIDQAAAEPLSGPNPVLPPGPPLADPVLGWRNLIEEAQRDRHDAARLFAEAVEDYEAAAERCADLLQPATNDRLRNHRRSLLDGIVHAVGGIGNAAVHVAAQAGEHLQDASAALRNFGLDHLDEVSEGLGIAAMATGFIPPLKGVSLALSGTKMAVDTSLVLAGRGEWSTVAKDAIGLALFGATRGLTEAARTTTAGAALRKLGETRGTISRLASRAAEGEELTEKTLKISRLTVRARHLDQVYQRFSTAAARPFLRRTFTILRDFRAELPSGDALSLSRTARLCATGVGSINAYGHYENAKKLQELDERYRFLRHMEQAE